MAIASTLQSIRKEYSMISTQILFFCLLLQSCTQSGCWNSRRRMGWKWRISQPSLAWQDLARVVARHRSESSTWQFSRCIFQQRRDAECYSESKSPIEHARLRRQSSRFNRAKEIHWSSAKTFKIHPTTSHEHDRETSSRQQKERPFSTIETTNENTILVIA